MIRTIDLNADLGEGFPLDHALLRLVTSASVCCGAHASDPETILQSLRWAGELGVVVGAHPGYADRSNFGRRELNLSASQIRLLVESQFETLEQLAATVGVEIRYVKPHGALYNQAHRDLELARALLAPIISRSWPVLGLPGGLVEQVASEFAAPFVAEGFADRRYRADGQLISRMEPGAILEDPAEIREQVLSLVDRGLQTICIHGDNPAAVDLAELVLDTLKRAGITARSFV